MIRYKITQVAPLSGNASALALVWQFCCLLRLQATQTRTHNSFHLRFSGLSPVACCFLLLLLLLRCTYADKTFGPGNNNNNNGNKNFSCTHFFFFFFWLRLQLHLFGKFLFLFFLSVETKQAHPNTHTHIRTHSYVLPHNRRDHTICAVSNCFLYQQSFRACSEIAPDSRIECGEKPE